MCLLIKELFLFNFPLIYDSFNMRIFYIAVILFGLFFFSGCSPQAPKVNADRPNIILLIGDDQGYPYFGFMGADYVHTPNMDALAASGTLFTNGYVSDNHCRPSLQTLLTGKLPIDYYRETGALFDALVGAIGICFWGLGRATREKKQPEQDHGYIKYTHVERMIN